MNAKLIALNLTESSKKQLFVGMKIEEIIQLIQLGKTDRIKQIKIFAQTADETRLVWFLKELSKIYDNEKLSDLFEKPNTLQEVKQILLTFFKYAGDTQIRTFSEVAPSNLFEIFGWHATKDQVIRFCLTARKEQTQAFVKEAEESRIDWFLDELVSLYNVDSTKATAECIFTLFCESAGTKQVIRFSEIAIDKLVELFSKYAGANQIETFSMFANEKQMIVFSKYATPIKLAIFFKKVLLDQFEVFSRHAGKIQIKAFCESGVIGDAKMKIFSKNAGEEQVKWFVEFANKEKIIMFSQKAGRKQIKWFMKYANLEKQGWFLGQEGNNQVNLSNQEGIEAKAPKWGRWIRNIFN
ncbi:MAG: hypothetical protein WCH76_01140 [Candidatus Riflemargulisbacteria bacterium]